MHISFQMREIKESPSLCIEEDMMLRKTIEIRECRRVGIFLDPVMSPPPPIDAPLLLIVDPDLLNRHTTADTAYWYGSVNSDPFLSIGTNSDLQLPQSSDKDDETVLIWYLSTKLLSSVPIYSLLEEFAPVVLIKVSGVAMFEVGSRKLPMNMMTLLQDWSNFKWVANGVVKLHECLKVAMA
ncbi:hypothetical protein LXL04_027013 [Taraxacum kok-saghyz]